jgi:hypothetical protein
LRLCSKTNKRNNKKEQSRTGYPHIMVKTIGG